MKVKLKSEKGREDLIGGYSGHLKGIKKGLQISNLDVADILAVEAFIEKYQGEIMLSLAEAYIT